MGIAENDPEGQARVTAFRQGLHDLKWQEGRNVRIDIRWGTGDASRIEGYAAELACGTATRGEARLEKLTARNHGFLQTVQRTVFDHLGDR